MPEGLRLETVRNRVDFLRGQAPSFNLTREDARVLWPICLSLQVLFVSIRRACPEFGELSSLIG